LIAYLSAYFVILLSHVDVLELPLSPENVEINQTANGVLVKWKTPKQRLIKIEYFQIYFREVNEKTNGPLSQFHNSHEWKTTEPISVDQTSYFIDDVDLVENRAYEIHIVSFSLHSKSPPSQAIKFRYLPNISRNLIFILVQIYSRSPDLVIFIVFVFLGSLKKSNLNHIQADVSSQSPFFFKSLLNMSQLDMVLIAIFLILMFVLVVCIIACIVYRRSAKKCRKIKKGIRFFSLAILKIMIRD